MRRHREKLRSLFAECPARGPSLDSAETSKFIRIIVDANLHVQQQLSDCSQELDLTQIRLQIRMIDGWERYERQGDCQEIAAHRVLPVCGRTPANVQIAESRVSG